MTTKTKTFTDNQVRTAIDLAFHNARCAFDKAFAKDGDHWGACGFAWVVVKPGNSKLAKILVKEYGARKHYAGGVSVWAPGASYTQNMDLKEVAAWSFAETLRSKLGLDYEKCHAGSRMD